MPVPEPSRGEALVRVRAVTICPSDWRMYVDGHAGGVRPERPIIQGHEFCGEVVALGPGATGPAPGTRVAVEPTWPCGRCDMCAAGRGNICRNVRFPSFPPVDGALAEFIVCPAEALCPVPEEMTDAEAALTEPLGVSLHALTLADPAPGASLCVLGAGVIGIGVLLLARRMGLGAPTVVEPVAARRRWVEERVQATAAASWQEPAQSGYEADVVMECSGDNEALDQAVHLCKPGGRIVVVGIPRDERITFDMSIARRRELTVIFCRRSFGELPECVRLLSSREVDFRDLPLRFYPLERAAEALAVTGVPGDFFRAVVLP